VFEHLDTAVIIIDQSLLIEDLNPAAESLLGISQDRARGESLLQLLGDNREIQDVFMRTLESGVTYANELRLGRTEVHEAERVIDCRVSLLREPPEKTRLLVEMSDVTRRSRISRENALIIQHGAGRQMVRQLAHEIKNPLGGLRGAAQLLDRQLDSDELKEYTNVIISEADRLASLVDTLLGPGGPPNKQALNVHELLEYVVRLTEAEQEKIMIRRDYDPGLPLFLLDRDQMVQAFLNLLQNASTALDGRGEITLRTRAIMNFTIGDIRHPAVASIEIEDDGPGIPPELQDSIFYPLVTTRPEGTGPAGLHLLSAGDDAARGHWSWSARGAGTHKPARWPDRIRKPARPHSVFRQDPVERFGGDTCRLASNLRCGSLTMISPCVGC
jgi:two-component system nitrogen regulation sensor histidine kinase GlnL